VASTSGWVADPQINAAFDQLLKAQAVAFGGVGIANIEGPESSAYFQILATGPAHLEPIHRLLDQASPAGRVFAATLLAAIDGAAGRRAWQRLAAQTDIVSVHAGCCFSESRLSSYAIKELARMGVDYAPEAGPVQFTTADVPLGRPVLSDTPHPAVDSVTAREAIIATFHGEPRIVFVTARDEQHFVESLFPDVKPPTAVYVSPETGTGRARGPHFDLYQAVVHRDYPFVATLNLVGEATVESIVLDHRLASYYFKCYPWPSETADTARHLVSAVALSQPRRQPVEEVRVGAGVGMIVPQQEFARPLVHDVRPDTDSGPGSHGLSLKFIVPRPDAASRSVVEEQGFTRWQPGTDWSRTEH
jgi:hypothetical protein